MLELFQSFSNFSLEFLIMILIILVMCIFKLRNIFDILKFLVISILISGFTFYLLSIILFFIRIILEEYTYIYFDDYIERIEIIISIISFLPALIIVSNSPFYLDEKELTFWEEIELKHKIKNTPKEKLKYINGKIYIDEFKEKIISKRSNFYNKNKLF